MMEELSDTESADMSIEDLSPSNPKMSDSPYQTVEKTASDKNHDIPRLAKDLNDPEHNVSLHGSFGIGNYVSQIRSCSPVSCQQHDLVAPSASPDSFYSACRHGSAGISNCQPQIEDQQGTQSSPIQALPVDSSLPDSVEHGIFSISPIQSSHLVEVSPDAHENKRRRFSLGSLKTFECDSQPASLTDQDEFLNTSLKAAKLKLIVSNEYVEEFLDSVSNHVYKTVLENLCPDNMRGSFCRCPDICIGRGRFFACPNYATLRPCRHGKSATFAHFGYKHTLKGCQVNDKIDCWKRHLDGRSCSVKVLHFHVRAACITLRGGVYCQKEPCEWGHDYKEIRRKVMSNKNYTQSYDETG